MEFFSGSAAFRGAGRDYTRPRRSSEAPLPFAWWPSVESGAFMLHGVWVPSYTQNTMLVGLRDVHRPVHCSLVARIAAKNGCGVSPTLGCPNGNVSRKAGRIGGNAWQIPFWSPVRRAGSAR
jgi:hypothetical protein